MREKPRLDFPGTSTPPSRSGRAPCSYPPASQPASAHSGRASDARAGQQERKARRSAAGFCSLTRVPGPPALAPPRSRRRVSTAMPQDPPEDSLQQRQQRGIRFFIGLRSTLAIFRFKISLSKFHYSSITSNLLSHAWSIKCK